MTLNQWSWISEELRELQASSRYRFLKTAEPIKNGRLRYHGKELLNLCSNNYLGISEELKLVGQQHDNTVPKGATASRLVVGNHPSFEELEITIARLKGTESSLIFSCGYMANIGTITALVGRGDAVYSDRLNHASIIDGARLSGAKLFRYRHCDLEHLQHLLEGSHRFRRKLIVTESLFSMDGDFAPLPALVEMRDQYETMIMIDEAHSGGIYGEHGAGLVNQMGLGDRVDIQMGTFSKAYGCFGAYIAGAKSLIDYLINKARSFIFTTALPPLITSLNLQAVKLCMRESWRRDRLLKNAEFFRDGLKELGLDTQRSTSYIVPIVVGDESQAMKFSDLLWDNWIASVAIRPPTVPQNTSRLRFSIMATHEQDDLQRALDAIRKSRKSIINIKGN